MSEIKLPAELVSRVIDNLRYFVVLFNWDFPGDLADELQFGSEGDVHDGHRCRLCDKLAGGDRSHRCWKEEKDTLK